MEGQLGRRRIRSPAQRVGGATVQQAASRHDHVVVDGLANQLVAKAIRVLALDVLVEQLLGNRGIEHTQHGGLGCAR